MALACAIALVASSQGQWPFPNTPTSWLYGVCGQCVKNRVQGNGNCVKASNLDTFRDSVDGAGATAFTNAVCDCCASQCRARAACSPFITYSIPSTEATSGFEAIAPPGDPIAAVNATAVPDATSIALGAAPTFDEFMAQLEACTPENPPCNIYFNVHTAFDFFLNPGLATGLARSPVVQVPTPAGGNPEFAYYGLREPATSANTNMLSIPQTITPLPSDAGLATDLLVSVRPGGSASDVRVTLERVTLRTRTEYTIEDPAGETVTNDQVIGIHLHSGQSGAQSVNGPVGIIFCGTAPLPPPLSSNLVTSPCRALLSVGGTLPPSADDLEHEERTRHSARTAGGLSARGWPDHGDWVAGGAYVGLALALVGAAWRAASVRKQRARRGGTAETATPSSAVASTTAGAQGYSHGPMPMA